MEEIIERKDLLMQTEIQQFISDCIYMPSNEKIISIIESYIQDKKTQVIGYKKDNHFQGVIVLEVNSDKTAFIKAIAVDILARRNGIGKKLIDAAVSRLTKDDLLIAETDDEAVGFYKSCGFEIENLGFKYKDIRRYKCRLNLELTK